jgi:hypothetical protein
VVRVSSASPRSPDMLLFTPALKDAGTSVPKIARKLTIKTGKNMGRHPSVESLYRALTEAEPATHSCDFKRSPAR